MCRTALRGCPGVTLVGFCRPDKRQHHPALSCSALSVLPARKRKQDWITAALSPPAPLDYALVRDGAVIGENSIVGAAAFVKAKAEMPADHLIIGSPAKAIRCLSAEEMEWKKRGTREYQVLVERCKLTIHQGDRCGKWKKGARGWCLTKNCGQNPLSKEVSPLRVKRAKTGAIGSLPARQTQGLLPAFVSHFLDS